MAYLSQLFKRIEMKSTLFILILLLIGNSSCQTTKNEIMEETNNPLLCDPETGMCEVPQKIASTDSNSVNTAKNTVKPIRIIYFTDPICSSCWGIEPQLRQLKLAYGSSIEIEYRMGGLLPDWSYNSGGISKPSDVAHHWDEVSAYYDMPIDGDVWLEDPLSSSYPPSIAFKAAQIQSKEKALLLLRELRTMVFLKKVNIAKWDNIEIAAKNVGLDTEQLNHDFNNDAKIHFEEDLELAQKMRVRGFPTLFFIDSLQNTDIIYGSRPYEDYEKLILKKDSNAERVEFGTNWEDLFAFYPSLTLREFSELSGKNKEESKELLKKLSDEGILDEFETKNGSIWKIVSNS